MEGEAAAAILKVAVKNVIDLAKNEISLIRGLKKNAGKLTESLDTIQKLLNDAETRSIPGDVESWLKRLEDVAFDADNVLDEFHYHLLSKKNKTMKRMKKKKVLSFPISLQHMGRKRKMAVKIKEINVNLQSINKEATDLGLTTKLADAPTLPDAAPENDPYAVVDSVFAGRDNDVRNLVEKLLTQSPEERKISILPIVGMPGIGKTTLAREVYHDQKIKAQFASLIWVHVSNNFDPVIIFKKILLELTLQTDGVENRTVLLKKIQEALKAKSYLLVLDDVWNEDLPKWEGFITSLLGVTSNMGNAIIITTRSKKVASIVQPFYTHKLNALSTGACWSIIKAKTFEKKDVPSNFETIGVMIAIRCQGSPLAANVVGGVLRNKSIEKWETIAQEWLSEEEGDNITNILRLSFVNLSSPSLKKCFAYCSVFARGDRINKRELIELWIAEGFIQPAERNDMESEGDKYFNVLLWSSLLQDAGRDGYGNVTSCVMHDLVHNLAHSILCSSPAAGTRRVRYMSCEAHTDESTPIPKQVSKYLRTLFFHGEIPGTMFSDLECLRALTLRSYQVKELPSSIGDLIHLRNLNISKTAIESLPDSIGKLHHLQTLRADGPSFRKLPAALTGLINLRHLYIHSGVELPAEIGRLTSLQTLTHFPVGNRNGGCKIEELGSLINLKGSLEICNLEEVPDMEEAQKADLMKKSKIVKLRLTWNVNREGETNDERVLEGLQPHHNVKKLTISGFRGKRIPLWTPSLNNQALLKLKISNCPNLRDLPDGLQTLTSLAVLTITWCPVLTWIARPSARPILMMTFKLRHLVIHECPELRILPCEMIESSLEILWLMGLSTLENLPKVIDCLANATGLRDLRIVGVPKFMAASSSDGTWHFPNMQILDIDASVEGSMETVNGFFRGCYASLERLYLKGMDTWECLPESMEILTHTFSLTIDNFGMVELPQWFGKVFPLIEMRVSNCQKLTHESFVDTIRLLNKLGTVYVDRCPQLGFTQQQLFEGKVWILPSGPLYCDPNHSGETISPYPMPPGVLLSLVMSSIGGEGFVVELPRTESE
ncbi:hypothetical protein C2S53_015396 [Perilla frutescens var. hirtella]|uniref:Uncharacterized protein n=1 Tax=Perilla frutescens var. hirtella TaxID=608512 RepID=A0AAD4P566_PERFH|nr:hypothetical protein C2S53_015396 [Perilla frutescens var. hirtella]